MRGPLNMGNNSNYRQTYFNTSPPNNINLGERNSAFLSAFKLNPNSDPNLHSVYPNLFGNQGNII
jgi:hypothetical protein